MRQESKRSRELVRELKKLMPGGVVFKHCDPMTSGVPDISVSFRGRTIWVEAKYVDDLTRIDYPNDDECFVEVVPKTDVDGLQWENLRRAGNGYLVVYTPSGVAFSHVVGFRTSIVRLRLALSPMKVVAKKILSAVSSTPRRGE